MGAMAKASTMMAKAIQWVLDDEDAEAIAEFDMAFYFWVPNRPAGLMSRTMVMITKITVAEASG
jgi:hypothetical protein